MRLKDLLAAPPSVLLDHQKKIENKFKDFLKIEDHFSKVKKKEIKDRREKIFKAFGYDYYKTRRFPEFIGQLKIKACPYCGSQYTSIIETKKKENSKDKFLFEIDHFIPKERYPYLSISFFNLIPSCSNCNKSKGKIELDTNFNPYHDELSFHELATFRIEDVSFLKGYLGFKEKYQHTFLEKRSLSKSERGFVEKYINQFEINEIYQRHNDTVDELIAKSLFYSSNRKDELLTFFKGRLSKSELNRMIVGNYVEDKDLLKRPLAKFTRDLAEDLNLLDW